MLKVLDVKIFGSYAYIVGLGAGKDVNLELWGDYFMSDDDFATQVNQVPCWRRAFWMQPCYSGGFIDDLEGSNTIITTACRWDQIARIADSISRNGSPLPENETYNDNTFYHGEFGFHIMNAVRGQALYDPTGGYEAPPEVDARIYNLNGVSMDEAAQYVTDHDSWAEIPQHSDMGGIGPTTFLLYNPMAPPDAPTNLTLVYCIPLENSTYLLGFDWDDNTEPDLSGYWFHQETPCANGHCSTFVYQSKIDSILVIHGATHMFWVTATDVYEGISESSNEIVWTPDDWPLAGIIESHAPLTVACNVSSNPVRYTADIRYQIAEKGLVNLKIYDAAGRVVKVLINKKMKPGNYLLKWEAENLKNGVYFITFQAGDVTKTTKVVIAR